MSSVAHIEIDIMQRLHQMPATPKELRTACPWSDNQVLWVLINLKADGLVARVPGTHLMRLVDL